MFQMLPKLSGILVIACVLTCVLIVVHSYPTNTAENTHKYANYHQIQPDPESLPPDTFRKLAQALYQGKANRLQRIFFQNSSITCNDGSVAGYYIRRNYSSQRWIIYLEGEFHVKKITSIFEFTIFCAISWNFLNEPFLFFKVVGFATIP